MDKKDADWLIELAQSLDDAGRFGAPVDDPEGARFIQMSDVLAKMISERLREIVERNPGS